MLPRSPSVFNDPAFRARVGLEPAPTGAGPWARLKKKLTPPVASTGMPSSMSLSAEDEEEARAEYQLAHRSALAAVDYQTQIHGLGQRVEELESEMRRLNFEVDQLRRPVAQG
jgi:hypothetical protein